MRDELFNRRKRMLTLLAARNKPSAVFKAVAEEFHVPVETVRRDYYNMPNWLHVVQQEEQATAIAVEGMDIGVRQATELLLGITPIRADGRLTVKQCFLKVAALNVYVKCVVEDNRFKQSIGVIVRKPEEVITHDERVAMPFQVDPLVRQALEASAAAQQEQRKLQDEQRQKDAAKDSEAQTS